MMKIKRSFLQYLLLCVCTIILGLASRVPAIPWPSFFATYAGDTLWGMMVFWGFCLCAPRAETRQVALAALVFAFAVEFSQFYQAPWIDAVRGTRLGGLILGFGFKASDLLCYTVGIGAGAVFDFFWQHRSTGVFADLQDE